MNQKIIKFLRRNVIEITCGIFSVVTPTIGYFAAKTDLHLYASTVFSLIFIILGAITAKFHKISQKDQKLSINMNHMLEALPDQIFETYNTSQNLEVIPNPNLAFRMITKYIEKGDGQCVVFGPGVYKFTEQNKRYIQAIDTFLKNPQNTYTRILTTTNTAPEISYMWISIMKKLIRKHGPNAKLHLFELKQFPAQITTFQVVGESVAHCTHGLFTDTSDFRLEKPASIFYRYPKYITYWKEFAFNTLSTMNCCTVINNGDLDKTLSEHKDAVNNRKVTSEIDAFITKCLL